MQSWQNTSRSVQTLIAQDGDFHGLFLNLATQMLRNHAWTRSCSGVLFHLNPGRLMSRARFEVQTCLSKKRAYFESVGGNWSNLTHARREETFNAGWRTCNLLFKREQLLFNPILTSSRSVYLIYSIYLVYYDKKILTQLSDWCISFFFRVRGTDPRWLNMSSQGQNRHKNRKCRHTISKFSVTCMFLAVRERYLEMACNTHEAADEGFKAELFSGGHHCAAP